MTEFTPAMAEKVFTSLLMLLLCVYVYFRLANLFLLLFCGRKSTDIMAAVIEEASLTADAESLKGTRDSILIRKSRLRRILSGGKIPQGEGLSPFSPSNSNKALIRQEKKLGTPTSSTTSTSRLTFYKGDGDEQRKDVVEGTVTTTTGAFACPATSWNLNEECWLDAFLVLFDEVENHKNKDVNGQFFLSKCE
jgi:hypothetical protein